MGLSKSGTILVAGPSKTGPSRIITQPTCGVSVSFKGVTLLKFQESTRDLLAKLAAQKCATRINIINPISDIENCVPGTLANSFCLPGGLKPKEKN